MGYERMRWFGPAARAARRALLGALVGGGLAFAGGSAWALSLSPLVMEIETGGRRSAETMTATNNSDRRVAIETEVTLDDDVNAPKEGVPDDILVFPPQFVLEPGASQAIRVQWLGDPVIRGERVYRVIVREVPVELEQPDVADGVVAAQLRLAFAFRTVLIVSPLGAVSDLRVAEADTVTNEAGGPFVRILFDNQGGARAKLSDFSFSLRHADGRTLGLGSAQWPTPDQWGQRRILGGRTRRLSLPLPDRSWLGDVEVSMVPR
ncbi:MAG: fimbria/pilus periplasmic chaperone [Pseudomonadota bacterium]